MSTSEQSTLKGAVIDMVVAESNGTLTPADILDVTLSQRGPDAAASRRSRRAAAAVEVVVTFVAEVDTDRVVGVEVAIDEAIAAGSIAVSVTAGGVTTEVLITAAAASVSPPLAGGADGSGGSSGPDPALVAGLTVLTVAVIAAAIVAITLRQRGCNRDGAFITGTRAEVKPCDVEAGATAAVASAAAGAGDPPAYGEPAVPLAGCAPGVVTTTITAPPGSGAVVTVEVSTDIGDGTATRRRSSVVSVTVIRAGSPESAYNPKAADGQLTPQIPGSAAEPTGN